MRTGPVPGRTVLARIAALRIVPVRTPRRRPALGAAGLFVSGASAAVGPVRAP
ncbi:hypothetical protein SCWH03_44110 [Streptomyces pacificus]|uniref:Uncharacterized protein n=1 Tax=Streptomyces pacificus TaxID=2705029 RepID=A0A6A0AZ02_9ACTN|nr:hypothetical protein SCWH03_44110 [Streptomyces pacificus]